MFSARVKTGVFVLEGLNSFATTLYFSYLFFHMRQEFGFTNLGNLTMCAVNGFVYMFAAWQGGRYAQQRGYFRALRLGFVVMAGALALGTLTPTVSGHFASMVLWTLGMCFTWPSLEAIVSEQEPPHRLQRLLGIYNVVWATAGGVANFVGGAVLEKLGPQSIFCVPAVIHVAQWVLAGRLARESGALQPASTSPVPVAPGRQAAGAPPRSPVPPAMFLKMAWLANPFAYIAINGLVPVIPRLAERLELTPTFAGFFCSVWFFARALSFVLLWLWTGWHYRFRWLASAYAGMAVCLAVILLAGRLWTLVVAQFFFGLCVGLIYYSSLFYSMDVGETKGEHGGIHEAAIGVGIFAGPTVGAASLHFFPGAPNTNAWAVSALLLAGLGALAVLRWRGPRQTN
jgi:predicted MFS family arabinose efflux permease